MNRLMRQQRFKIVDIYLKKKIDLLISLSLVPLFFKMSKQLLLLTKQFLIACYLPYHPSHHLVMNNPTSRRIRHEPTTRTSLSSFQQ